MFCVLPDSNAIDAMLLTTSKCRLAAMQVDFDVHTAKLCEVADLTAEHERLDSVIQQKVCNLWAPLYPKP